MTVTAPSFSILENQKKISIITVVFNDKNHISRTIDSVLAQDYKHIEYIVIDGKSDDGTSDIIKNYINHLDAYVCEHDDGVYDAMNKAIKIASGDFLLFMNSGDIFASANAISCAMNFIHPGSEQVLFGKWIRGISKKSMTHCQPVLQNGIFNHQAIIYSHSIHAWHGNYLNIKGLTTSDYLFFVSLLDSPKITCAIIDVTLAVIDINGISSGLQTFSQKYAIDFICGRTSKMKLLLVLITHPIYRRVKDFLKCIR